MLKIKKLDDESMIIHTKKKAKIHIVRKKELPIKGRNVLSREATLKIRNAMVDTSYLKDDKSNERDEDNAVVYKDVCNPITKEFREELYGQILEAYDRAKDHVKGTKSDEVVEMPEFSVSVTPFEREGSNIRGLARIFFEDSFIVNNVTILQGKDNLFVAMPSYKTKQVDEQGKPIYNDICYPVTKEFREKLYAEILAVYEREKEKKQEQSQSKAEEKAKDDFVKVSDKELPFR